MAHTLLLYYVKKAEEMELGIQLNALREGFNCRRNYIESE